MPLIHSGRVGAQCTELSVQARPLRPSLKLSEVSFAAIPNSVAVGPRGQLALLGEVPFLVLDSNFARPRQVGRKGDGPGDHRLPADAVFIVGDSLVVMDALASRFVVYGRDLKASRTIPIPYQSLQRFQVIRWPDSVVVTGWIRTPAAAGFGVHLVSLAKEFRILASFAGDLSGSFKPSRQFDPAPIVSVAGTTLLSFDPLEFQIRRWRTDAKPAGISSWRPSWFAGRSVNSIGSRTDPPPPRIAWVDQQSNGELLVGVLTAAPAWKSAWASAGARRGEVQASSVNYAQLFQTRILLLDREHARCLAETVVGGVVTGVIGSTRVLAYQEDESGEPFLRVLQLTFSRK